MLFNLFLSFPIALLLIRFLMDVQSLVVDSDIGGAIIGRSEIDVIADYCLQQISGTKLQQLPNP